MSWSSLRRALLAGTVAAVTAVTGCGDAESTADDAARETLTPADIHRLEIHYDDGTFRGPWDGSKAADELPLMAVNALDVMWFAWVGFYPETAVVSDADL